MTLICKICKQNTKTEHFPFSLFHSGLRVAAYNSLSLWCKIAKSGSLVESVADELIKYILQDITPYQSEVTLKVRQTILFPSVVINFYNHSHLSIRFWPVPVNISRRRLAKS